METEVKYLIDGAKVCSCYDVLVKIPCSEEYLSKGFIPPLRIPLKTW